MTLEILKIEKTEEERFEELKDIIKREQKEVSTRLILYQKLIKFEKTLAKKGYSEEEISKTRLHHLLSFSSTDEDENYVFDLPNGEFEDFIRSL